MTPETLPLTEAVDLHLSWEESGWRFRLEGYLPGGEGLPGLYVSIWTPEGHPERERAERAGAEVLRRLRTIPAPECPPAACRAAAGGEGAVSGSQGRKAGSMGYHRLPDGENDR